MVLTGLPGLLLPFYTHGINPCVTYVSPDSPVTGPRGLKQGKIINLLYQLLFMNLLVCFPKDCLLLNSKYTYQYGT